MNKKIKDALTVIVLAVFIFGFAAAHLILPDTDILKTERRPAAQLPYPSAGGISNGKFMSDFEQYSLDQFPLRESFRSVKAFSNYYLYSRQDNNGIYISNGSAVKIEYPLDTDSLIHASDRFNFVYKRYMDGKDMHVYFSVIPDKNYFDTSGKHLRMNYDSLTERMKSGISFARYIDIFDTLDITDYYKTDTHWRQECIGDTARCLAEAMGATLDDSYSEITAGEPFYGVYYGQAALPMDPDKLCYLESDTLTECTVYDFESGSYIPVYEKSKLLSDDPYEMFLSGSKSLLVIENPNAETDSELIMFRDSFGSSLAPLFTSGYKKITLVDIRYISSEILDRFIDFKDQDVLFIYSASVLNNSVTLK